MTSRPPGGFSEPAEGPVSLLSSEDGGTYSWFASAPIPAVSSDTERGIGDKPFVPASPENVNALSVIFGWFGLPRPQHTDFKAVNELIAKFSFW